MAKNFYTSFSKQMDRLQSSVGGFGNSAEDQAEPAQPSDSSSLPIDAISPGMYQPRRTFKDDQLQELVDSIRQQGLLQPIVVRPVADGKYEILAGERRWRACKQLGRDTIEVIVKDVGDQSAVAMSLVENIQREDLNAMEEAEGYQRLIGEFGLKQAEVADLVGKSRSRISRLLALVSLPDDLKQLIREDKLNGAHGIVLATSGLEPERYSALAAAAVKGNWSRDQLNKAIRHALSPAPPAATEPESVSAPAAPTPPAAGLPETERAEPEAGLPETQKAETGLPETGLPATEAQVHAEAPATTVVDPPALPSPDWSRRMLESMRAGGAAIGNPLAAHFDPATGSGEIRIAFSARDLAEFEESAMRIIDRLQLAASPPVLTWLRSNVLRGR